MRLSFSCVVEGLPCLRIVCYRIGGKLAWSLNWAEGLKIGSKRNKRQHAKSVKIISGGGNEVDEAAMSPVKKTEPHGIVVFFQHTCWSVVCCQRIPPNLRKVTGVNSINIHRMFQHRFTYKKNCWWCWAGINSSCPGPFTFDLNLSQGTAVRKKVSPSASRLACRTKKNRTLLSPFVNFAYWGCSKPHQKQSSLHFWKSVMYMAIRPWMSLFPRYYIFGVHKAGMIVLITHVLRKSFLPIFKLNAGINLGFAT